MFKGLQIGQTSRVIPVIGTLLPIFLLVYYSLFAHSISYNQIWAVGILTAGLLSITLPYFHGKLILHEVLFELLAALFFAAAYILLYKAYTQAPFLTVFAYSRLVLIPIGALILVIPEWRKSISSHHHLKVNFFSPSGILFILAQIFGGVSELLVTVAISLANPALVVSLQGVQYIVILSASVVLGRIYPNIFKEGRSLFRTIAKTAGILLIGVGLYILALSGGTNSAAIKKHPLSLGVTYSPQYAKDLGLDPQSTYIRMLDELKPSSVRLPVYWDQVEEEEGFYDFSGADFYVAAAQKRGISIVLGIGYKQPRWPECYLPSWAQNLPRRTRDQKLLDLLKAEVTHFKNYSAIKIWQVENEPFLQFGLCETRKTAQVAELLKQEVKVVKLLDERPVLITDSGELSGWDQAMRSGDYFGFTLYRRVWNRYLGMIDYPFPPVYYQVKGGLSRTVSSGKLNGTDTDERSFISELQAEPWTTGVHIVDMPIYEQTKAFPASKLSDNVKFARETTFHSAYLWGAEWWYWMEEQGYPEYLDSAKELFTETALSSH